MGICFFHCFNWTLYLCWMQWNEQLIRAQQIEYLDQWWPYALFDLFHLKRIFTWIVIQKNSKRMCPLGSIESHTHTHNSPITIYRRSKSYFTYLCIDWIKFSVSKFNSMESNSKCVSNLWKFSPKFNGSALFQKSFGSLCNS